MHARSSDDWFAEEKVPETRHDAYTRRLVAWGYLSVGGFCAWEHRPSPLGQMAELLREYYIPQLKADLNRKVYGSPWWLDPERKEP